MGNLARHSRRLYDPCYHPRLHPRRRSRPVGEVSARLGGLEVGTRFAGYPPPQPRRQHNNNNKDPPSLLPQFPVPLCPLSDSRFFLFIFFYFRRTKEHSRGNWAGWGGRGWWLLLCCCGCVNGAIKMFDGTTTTTSCLTSIIPQTEEYRCLRRCLSQRRLQESGSTWRDGRQPNGRRCLGVGKRRSVGYCGMRPMWGLEIIRTSHKAYHRSTRCKLQHGEQ